MIDGLVAQCGERLSSLWKRDDGGTGLYPPPTLHVSINSVYVSLTIIFYLYLVLFGRTNFNRITDRPCWTFIYLTTLKTLSNMQLYPLIKLFKDEIIFYLHWSSCFGIQASFLFTTVII